MKSSMVDMESNTTLVQNYPAHEAIPDGEGPFPAIVLAHDRFGLSLCVRGIGNRLAQAGFYTLTPALYALPTSFVELAPDWMHAAGPVGFTPDQESQAEDRAATLSDERATSLIERAIRYAQGRPETRSGPVGLLGFSMGGRFAFQAACDFADQVGVCVCFYPEGLFSSLPGRGRQMPVARASSLKAPLLLLYGARDERVAASERGSLATLLRNLGKDVALEEYRNAGHDFICSDSESFRVGAANRAWKAMLAFFKTRLCPSAGPGGLR